MLVILIALLPMNVIMIYYRLSQTKAFTLSDMIIYPLLFGVPLTIIILVLNKYFLKYNFKTTFNSGKSSWTLDLFFAFVLVLLYFGVLMVTNYLKSTLSINNHVASMEVINAIQDLAKSPLLMLIWFGPVLWIGIALFEELSRVFFMKCLWNIWENKYAQFLMIIFVSVIIGLTHLYQGPIGVISIGFKSVKSGIFYFKYRRIFPLIIAHGLYDGIQFLIAIIQINGL
jgi:membrane protease YdiL (CAAX protease family)